MGGCKRLNQDKMTVTQLWRYRFGKKLGLTRAEYMVSFYGDICKEWKKQKYEDKWEYLRSIDRFLRRERLRNVIGERVRNFMLSDIEIDKRSKSKPLGMRNVCGWIFFQPDNLIDGGTYKNRMDTQALALEKSGENVIETIKQKMMIEVTNGEV